MKPARIFIVHFAPIELYPPIQNFLRLLDGKPHAEEIKVITTTSVANLSSFVTKNIRIIRKGKSSRYFHAYQRYANYLKFYFSCLRLLFYHRPKKVLYYETLSSFPVYIYKTIFNKKVSVFIHYHEYTSKEEYKDGMVLSRVFHRLEKQLYPTALSVSHTNPLRMEKFKQDVAPVLISRPAIFPNYPPVQWRSKSPRVFHDPVKIIYVGSLSLKTMYTEEFAHWVMACQGNVIWDIYSFNYTSDAAQFISSLRSNWINLKQGIDYARLPEILKQYDVGVILYNGHIPNYIYNAPNKLFEYLACDLDVWFPIEMIGCYEYITKKKFPRVVGLNFQHLLEIQIKSLASRNDLLYQPSGFYCEPVYEKLFKTLVN